ncbi:MAG: glycosyltransferase family 4 protein [Elusimicrobiales bacterium]|nr:glycosyltransferase family 4 protein [Elusimicrobiales bacterium]
MNVLNVCDGEAWDITAYQALNTALQFVRLKHNAAVLCPKGSRLYAECQKQKITALPLTLGAKFGFFKPGGFDVVHFYNPAGITPLFFRKARASSRVFITQIKLGSQKNFSRLAALEPYVDNYVAACNSVQEDLVRAGVDQRKIFMVPPGINIGRWESAMLIKPAMFQKRPYRVGTVSMDRTLKEQQLFLMMAREVLEALPDTNFMIVGLKDERIRAFARALGISHKVDILWDRNDVPEIMAMMHIYAKTARREGMSLSLIEAQASGVACVLPRLRGLSDFTVHDRNGLLVEPDNVASCAQAVIRLVNNPEMCHNFAKMAFGYVNNNMSIPVVANLLLRLYDDALQK